MKRYFIYGALFISAVAFVVLAFNIGGAGTDNIAQLKTGGIKDPENIAILEDVKKQSEDYREIPPSSVDKIDQAWQDEKMGAEDYVKLQVKAIYGETGSLPSEYRGEVDNSKDYAYLYGLMTDQWQSFSQQTRDMLLPFLLPARNPASYFYPKKTDGDRRSILEKIVGLESAHAEEVLDIVANNLIVNNRVIVTYGDLDEKPKAEFVAQGVRDSLPKFSSMLGMDYKTISIYLAGSELKADGQASPDPNDANICNVQVNKNQDEKGLKSTTAHEIFHCYQFWRGMKYIQPETKWVMEGTATWSEDYVYHNYNSEQQYLGDFFPRTNIDVMSLKGNHEYAMYVWFYYLYQKAGFNSYDIVDALDWGKINAVRQGMMARNNFNYEYRDFALWNWNRDQYKRYQDEPTFPSHTPYWYSAKNLSINSTGDKPYEMKMDKGGMLYSYLTINNDNIKKIDFQLKNYNGAKTDSDKGLQALYKVNGHWVYEDWTGLESRQFCRNLDEENIEMVLLISSNADIRNKADGKINIKSDKECDPGWRGTLTYKWEYKNNLTLGWAQGKYTEKGELRLTETLEYDPEYDNLLVVDQQYFGKYDELTSVESPGKDCGQMWTRKSKNLGGGGYVKYKDKEDRPERMNGDGSEDVNKIGGNYEIYFQPFGAPDGYGKKFSGNWSDMQMNKPCTGGMLPEASGLSKNAGTSTTDEFAYEPPQVKIVIDPKDKQIKGSAKFEYHTGVFVTAEWDYQQMR